MTLTDKPLLGIASWTVIHPAACSKTRQLTLTGLLHEEETDKPGSVVTVIHLGQQSLTGSSSLPGFSTGRTFKPLFGLAPGVELPCHGLPFQPRGALLPHPFNSYRSHLRGPSAVCLCCTGRGFPRALPHPALCGSPDFRPSPRKVDDEAATVWSASARSIEGSRDFVTLRCAFLSPERQQHFWMPDKYCQSAPKSLPPASRMRVSTLKTASMPYMMHLTLHRASGCRQCQSLFMIFFATFATPIGTFTANNGYQSALLPLSPPAYSRGYAFLRVQCRRDNFRSRCVIPHREKFSLTPPPYRLPVCLRRAPPCRRHSAIFL